MSHTLPGWVAAAARWRQRFFTGVEVVIFIHVLVLLGLILLQVFTRYVMHAALPWTEEVARMVLVWTVMLGAAMAMERRQHYAITLLSDQFEGMLRLTVMLVTNVLGLIFLVALARYGAEYMTANMRTTYVSTQVSRGWVYLSLPVGAAIMAASLLLHSLEAWFERKAPPPGSGGSADGSVEII